MPLKRLALVHDFDDLLLNSEQTTTKQVHYTGRSSYRKSGTSGPEQGSHTSGARPGVHAKQAGYVGPSAKKKLVL